MSEAVGLQVVLAGDEASIPLRSSGLSKEKIPLVETAGNCSRPPGRRVFIATAQLWIWVREEASFPCERSGISRR